eukprot:gene2697-3471_t
MTQSLARALSTALRVQGDSPFLGTPTDGGEFPYAWCSYREVADDSAMLAAGLGLYLPRRSSLAIALGNRREWLVCDFASCFSDFMNVGIHLAWSPEKSLGVLADAESRALVTDTRVAQTLLLEAEHLQHTSLSLVVLVDCAEEKEACTLQRLAPASIQVLTWEQVLEQGQRARRTHTGFGFGDDVAVLDLVDDPAAPYTVMYSSGTTGGSAPKGIVTSKAAWGVSNANPGPFGSISDTRLRCGISHMSLAHGADRGVAWFATFAGARLGFTRAGGGVAQFVEHARQLKPSFVLGMATLWSDLYEWHVAALNLALQQSLRERWPDVDIPIDSPEWSRITSAFLATRRGGAIRVRLLRQSRQDLGGCLQVVATGGSRTPSEVLKFM